MRKSDKLRAIYAELRRAAGPEAASGDILKLAHIIFRTYNAQDDEVDRSGIARKSRFIGSLPLDEALSDNGWRVWSYEEHRAASIDTLDSIEKCKLEHQLDLYLGSTWRYQIPPD